MSTATKERNAISVTNPIAAKVTTLPKTRVWDFDLNSDLAYEDPGSLTADSYWGNYDCSEQLAPGRTSFHKDHLGSTTVVTDEFGNIPPDQPALTQYRPYGTTRAGYENRVNTVTDYNFTDQELDRSTGFYNYDARLYNPDIAMFITADTVLPEIYDPQQLNRYAYCRNNPMIYIDPSGHEFGRLDNIATRFTFDKDKIDPVEGGGQDISGFLQREVTVDGKTSTVGKVLQQALNDSRRSWSDLDTTAKTRIGGFFQKLGQVFRGELNQEISVTISEAKNGTLTAGVEEGGWGNRKMSTSLAGRAANQLKRGEITNAYFFHTHRFPGDSAMPSVGKVESRFGQITSRELGGDMKADDMLDDRAGSNANVHSGIISRDGISLYDTTLIPEI